MGRPGGDSTFNNQTDQQPQEYDLQPQEYQYDTTNYEPNNNVPNQEEQQHSETPEINYSVNPTQEDQYQPNQNTSKDNPEPQLQVQKQYQQFPVPSPTPRLPPSPTNQPYNRAQPQAPARQPPPIPTNQHHNEAQPQNPVTPVQFPPQNLQNNPLYQSQQGQQPNNISTQPVQFPPQPQPQPQQFRTQPTAFPPQQQQPMNFPQNSSPLHPTYQQGGLHNNINNINNSGIQPAAFPPPQVPQQMPPQAGNFQPQAYPSPQVYNNTQDCANNYYIPQPQASPFHVPQSGGQCYMNNQIPPSPHKSPMVQANVAAPGIPVQVTQAGQQLAYNEGWNTQLFDCMDDPTNAVMTCFFPCLTFGQVAEIIDNGHTSCATSGMLYCLVASFIGLPCLMSFGYRSKLRAKFGLIEAPAPDWLVHCFCEPFALCQEYRELNRRGWDPSIGWQGNVARHNMQQAQVAMMPPMKQTMMP